jgi:small subunit ribosomal protein S4
VGRYTGPVEKLSRREGVELYLKGERALNGKSALERRGPAPPGQHGARRGRRPSIYAEQLRAKQRAKRYYGVRERQFRKYVREAARHRERVTGEELLRLLERRLDNVVYRLGFASTRAQARQFVNHGHVTVDGRRVDVASYAVKPGQEVAIAASSPVREVSSAMTELTGTVAPWLQTDFDGLNGKVLRLPERAEISAPIDEHLIVELYSRL